MSLILNFIEIFKSPSNIELFSEVSCYWFALILHERFPVSSIVYNPHQVHFATKIKGTLYDINGVIEDASDYVDWEEYKSYASDIDIISRYCINLERR